MDNLRVRWAQGRRELGRGTRAPPSDGQGTYVMYTSSLGAFGAFFMRGRMCNFM